MTCSAVRCRESGLSQVIVLRMRIRSLAMPLWPEPADKRPHYARAQTAQV